MNRLVNVEQKRLNEKKVEVKNDHRSKFSNLSNWKKKPEKNWASTGFEPVTSAIPVRCFTNIGSEVNLLSSYIPVQWSDVKYIIYEIIHICTAVVDEVKNGHRSKVSNLSNWKEEA